MNYYEILELSPGSTKEEIKKKYYTLCRRYHPDKNNGKDKIFKKINEAYDILYNDEERKKYDIRLLFGEIEFTEEDIIILDHYYNKLINSNEFKLMKLLYESIPKNVKNEIWNKFKKTNQLHIVKAQKSIDIRGLKHDEIINLYINFEDYRKCALKVLYLFTNNGYYYLFMRNDYSTLIIDNLTCKLTLKFFIKE